MGLEQIDTFGDLAAFLQNARGEVALSINPEGKKSRKQAPKLTLEVFRRVDKART
jgi:hypothetical protein